MEQTIENSLNTLSEAERAGGRVLYELMPLAQSARLRELLKKVGHDEGYYAGELSAHVRRLGGQPSNKTGDFVDKVRAVQIFKDKLALLNRGQRWVMRKIEEILPSIADAELQGFLVVMKDGHQTNIRALEEALQNGIA
jgi:nitronate monooxygenase